MLKLPRTALPPAELERVEAYFQADVRPVCEASATLVSYQPFDAAIQESLKITARTGCFTQGLEAIERLLDAEKKGLTEVQKRTGQAPAQRMSRLLFISNDGSERFYRQVGALMVAHGNRIWACRLDGSSEDLGGLLAMRKSPAKALLINDKKALALFLTSLSRLLESR